MGFFSHKQTISDDELMRDFGAAIEQFVEALLAGDTDVDLKLAEMVENVPEHVRIAIVEKMREMVRARDEEKAKALDQAIDQQKLLEKKSKAYRMQIWLAHVMSQETLRKIREAFMSRPGLQKEIENIGQELAKKGVLQNLNPGGKQDLGELSAQVQHQQRQGQDKGQGRS